MMLLRVDPRAFSHGQVVSFDLELPELEDVTSWRWHFD
jgi:protein arginine N-methyltransferase 1